MKREELKAYEGSSIYRVLECNPHNDDEQHLEEIFNDKSEFKFYEKAEADKVFDYYEKRIVELDEDYRKMSEMYIAEQTKAAKYEQRIKELEEANKRTQKHREEVEASESNIRQEMFKMKARIKELEAEVIGYKASLERANFKMCEKDARIKELEAENARLHQANFDALAHFDTLKEDYDKLKATISILENKQKENNK